MRVIGIDVGGTRIRIGLIDQEGHVDRIILLRTADYQDPSAILGAIGDAAHETIKRENDIVGIGLAMPGIFAENTNRPLLLSNLAFLQHADIRGQLESRLGLPTVIETDANAAALAEYRLGAGQGSERLLVVSVGTGVGVGVLLGGRLARHTRGTGGSLGHIVIEANGPECGCGGRGCVEALASGGAFLKQLGINPNEVNNQTWDEIMVRLRQGESQIAKAVETIGRSLGVGVAGWLALYQPDRVVLRGGVTALGPTWLDAVTAGMLNVGSPHYAKSVAICLGELGDDAGVIGAGISFADPNDR
jgi:glucokinase